MRRWQRAGAQDTSLFDPLEEQQPSAPAQRAPYPSSSPHSATHVRTRDQNRLRPRPCPPQLRGWSGFTWDQTLSCMPLYTAGMSRARGWGSLPATGRRFMRSSSELQSGGAIEHTGRSKDSNASAKAADAPRKRSKLQFVVLHRNWRHKTRVTRHNNPRT